MSWIIPPVSPEADIIPIDENKDRWAFCKNGYVKFSGSLEQCQRFYHLNNLANENTRGLQDKFLIWAVS